MMQCVDIYLIDYDESDRNESLGIKNKQNPKKTAFWFNDALFSGFYIDDEIDDYTDSEDIVFFVGSSSYRTPFNPETFELFTSILRGYSKLIFNLQ